MLLSSKQSSLFATWVQLGGLGSSRWTAFFADGDGNFRPRIMVDGRKAEKTPLLTLKDVWPQGGHGDYRIDFDKVAWRLRDDR